MEDVLKFLSQLSVNNSREWFDANRDQYKKSREKMLFITDLFINEIRKFDAEIPVMDPKNCMFRIFRDVRFSNDKRPYKTNFGSFIAKGGRKSQYAGYYFHVEPGESFIGGGVYMPDKEPLNAIRQYISKFPEEFLEIINHPDFKAIYPELYDHQLKTAPKGFSTDHGYIHLLRYKSFVFSAPVTNEELINGKFIDKTVSAFKQLHKINSWLNDAMKNFSD